MEEPSRGKENRKKGYSLLAGTPFYIHYISRLVNWWGLKIFRLQNDTSYIPPKTDGFGIAPPL